MPLNSRQLIYNYPEQLFADAGVMAIEHADFEGVERLALVLGSEIVSTFGKPELVKLGHCKLIEEVMIGEDQVSGNDDGGVLERLGDWGEVPRCGGWREGRKDENVMVVDEGVSIRGMLRNRRRTTNDDDVNNFDWQADSVMVIGDNDDCNECSWHIELQWYCNFVLVNPFLWLCSKRSVYNSNSRSNTTNTGRSWALNSWCSVRLNSNCQRN